MKRLFIWAALTITCAAVVSWLVVLAAWAGNTLAEGSPLAVVQGGLIAVIVCALWGHQLLCGYQTFSWRQFFSYLFVAGLSLTMLFWLPALGIVSVPPVRPSVVWTIAGGLIVLMPLCLLVSDRRIKRVIAARSVQAFMKK